jgi:hypothetical protein
MMFRKFRTCFPRPTDAKDTNQRRKRRETRDDHVCESMGKKGSDQRTWATFLAQAAIVHSDYIKEKRVWGMNDTP